VPGQTPHKRDQALDLFLGEIRVGRHGAGFTDGGSPALNDGPNPIIGGVSLPVCVCQVLRFFSKSRGGRTVPFPIPSMTNETSGLKKLLPIRLIALVKQTWMGRRGIPWLAQPASACEPRSKGNKDDEHKSYSHQVEHEKMADNRYSVAVRERTKIFYRR
jgi:hypothetical protein